MSPVTKHTYKKYNREDQRALAAWAADCAERVLPLFEEIYPGDDRPRKSIETCRAWARSGVFRMAAIRAASLGAHTAAREAIENSAAYFAARAAGQAVATAHVPQHAWGSAMYALKALVAQDPADAEDRLAAEYGWQCQRLPEHLRLDMLERIILEKKGKKVLVKIRKSEGF